MSKEITVYTQLLEAALKVSEGQERASKNKEDKKDWRHLNRTCRLELYKARKKIAPSGLDKGSKGRV